MSTTLKHRKEAFIHVTQNVIRLHAPEIAVLSDFGYDNIIRLITMADSDLYKMRDSLTSTTRDRIIAFICFFNHINTTDQWNKDKEWLTLSCYDFDAFCESMYFAPYRGKTLEDSIATIQSQSEPKCYKLQYPLVHTMKKQVFLHVLTIMDMTHDEIQRLDDFGFACVSKLQNITEAQLTSMFSEPQYGYARNIIRRFVYFLHYVSANDHSFLANELLQLSAADFDQFYLSKVYDDYYSGKSLDDFVAIDAINTSSCESIPISPGSQDQEKRCQDWLEDVTATLLVDAIVGASTTYNAPISPDEPTVVTFFNDDSYTPRTTKR